MAAQAAAQSPDLAHIQTVLGFAYLSRIETDRAKVAFDRAIALNQAAPLPRLGRGLALIREGDTEAGRASLETAVALDPLRSLYRSYLGKAYFEEKRDTLASDQYALAKRFDPFDPTPWLYDAILKQTENRPVEALEDIQQSIALNDNRAVYRSRLLLDEDRATRGTSLARIYDDLGFEQLAVNEASKSLSFDPANASAHRFLSQTFAGLPRREAARISELLQAQLLQSINANPVSPSFAETDLNIIAEIGPNDITFNEFTPVFEQENLSLAASGFIGNNDTLGSQTALSGIFKRFAYSVGQFSYDSDGFRENNYRRHDIYTVFGQAQLTNRLDLQVEYRRRETDEGDLRLNYNPNDFNPFLTRKIESNISRISLRFQPSPQSSYLFTAAYIDREEKLEQLALTSIGVFPETNSLVDEGYDFQSQFIHRSPEYSVILGADAYTIDGELKQKIDAGNPCPFGTCAIETPIDKKQKNIYGYGNFAFPKKWIWTLGLGYVSLEDDFISREKITPKIGLRWRINDAVDLRFAALQSVKRNQVIEQTLEPTQLAGFPYLFDDFNGTLSEYFGAGIDFNPTPQVYSGLEYYRRNLEVPRTLGSREAFEKQREDVYHAYLNTILNPRWVLSAGFRYEKFQREFIRFESGEPFSPVKKLKTITLPIMLNYFNPKGFFAKLETTYVHQEIKQTSATAFTEDHEHFVITDTTLGYRLPNRRGIAEFKIANLLDKNFLFQDTNIQSSQASNPRFIPDRSILFMLTLNFE